MADPSCPDTKESRDRYFHFMLSWIVLGMGTAAILIDLLNHSKGGS